MQYEIIYARSNGNSSKIIGAQIGNQFIRKKGTENEHSFIKRLNTLVSDFGKSDEQNIKPN